MALFYVSLTKDKDISFYWYAVQLALNLIEQYCNSKMDLGRFSNLGLERDVTMFFLTRFCFDRNIETKAWSNLFIFIFGRRSKSKVSFCGSWRNAIKTVFTGVICTKYGMCIAWGGHDFCLRKLAQTLDWEMAKLRSKTRSSKDGNCTGHWQLSWSPDLFRS